MNGISKDLGSGLLFTLAGAAAATYAYATLRIGTPFKMGPGFFPLVLSLMLIVLGLAKCLVATMRPNIEAWGPVPWRALVLIPAAMVIFGLVARPLGMIPSLVILCMIAAYASREMGLVRALILSAAMTAFCVLVFGFLLRVPLPLWGTLLS